MQKNLNKGEKNLVRNALSVLDLVFGNEPSLNLDNNRLAARNMYVKSLNKAIAENNTEQLVQLTNKEHVQNLGKNFKGMSSDGFDYPEYIKEEGIILMERPLEGLLEGLHNGNVEDNYGYVRHEQFISLKDDYNFGKFKDGGIREDDPNLRSKYIQRDKRVFKKNFIMQAKMELEKEAEEEKKKALLVDTDNPEEDYYPISKNCLHYANDIISRAESLAEAAGESLYFKY